MASFPWFCSGPNGHLGILPSNSRPCADCAQAPVQSGSRSCQGCLAPRYKARLEGSSLVALWSLGCPSPGWGPLSQLGKLAQTNIEAWLAWDLSTTCHSLPHKEVARGKKKKKSCVCFCPPPPSAPAPEDPMPHLTTTSLQWGGVSQHCPPTLFLNKHLCS